MSTTDQNILNKILNVGGSSEIIVMPRFHFDFRENPTFTDWVPSECSQKSLLDLAFTKYASLLITVPFKIVAIVGTLALLSSAAYGLSELKAEFKFTVFLDQGTYLRNYFDVNAEVFPNRGISGTIYVAEKENVHQLIPEIMAMIEE